MVRHVFILGATSAGKSALALALAERTAGCVANMDAFQVYRGLDVGTGKASAEERSRVEHALLDLAGPLDEFSVANYLQAAQAWLAARQRGVVIWAGGTGLYYRSLRRGLAPAPASDPELVAELESWTPEARIAEVKRVDPEWASGADLANPRRVIRALAVFRQTGRPLSAWQKDAVQALVPEGTAWMLQMSPERLRRRIEQRVEAMWASGWPEEVRKLAELPGWEQVPAARALGYSEVLQWLRRGGDAASVRAAIVQRTWQYARRQLTWFRREPNIKIIEIDESFDPQVAAEALCSENDMICSSCP